MTREELDKRIAEEGRIENILISLQQRIEAEYDEAQRWRKRALLCVPFAALGWGWAIWQAVRG